MDGEAVACGRGGWLSRENCETQTNHHLGTAVYDVEDMKLRMTYIVCIYEAALEVHMRVAGLLRWRLEDDWTIVHMKC